MFYYEFKIKIFKIFIAGKGTYLKKNVKQTSFKLLQLKINTIINLLSILLDKLFVLYINEKFHSSVFSYMNIYMC